MSIVKCPFFLRQIRTRRTAFTLAQATIDSTSNAAHFYEVFHNNLGGTNSSFL